MEMLEGHTRLHQLRNLLGPAGAMAIVGILPAALLTGLSTLTVGLAGVGLATIAATFFEEKRESARNKLETQLERGASDYLNSLVLPGSSPETRLDKRFAEKRHGLESVTLVENISSKSVEEVHLTLNDRVKLKAHQGGVDFELGPEKLTLPGTLSLPTWENDGTLAYECKDRSTLESARSLLQKQGLQVGGIAKGQFFFGNNPIGPSNKRQDYQDRLDDWYFEVTTPPSRGW